MSGRVLELFCLTEFTVRKRLRFRQDSDSPRRVWRRLQSGTDQSLQSPLLTNTKESISARVGLGRKRYLGNITKGQSLSPPPSQNVTVADTKRNRKGLSFEGLEKKATPRSHANRGLYWTVNIIAQAALLLNFWINF